VAPTLSVSLSPNYLWPRTTNLFRHGDGGRKHTCDANPTVQLVSITSSDPLMWMMFKLLAVDKFRNGRALIHAEREGSSSETVRVYTVTYAAKDARVTRDATAQVQVGNPHSTRHAPAYTRSTRNTTTTTRAPRRQKSTTMTNARLSRRAV